MFLLCFDLCVFWWAIDVLKEFASKKCGKLGKLLKETGSHGIQMKHKDSRALNPSRNSKSEFGSIKVINFYVNAAYLSV